MIEFAKLWLPIGAGIFITLGISTYFADKKILGIWFAFSGAVCLLLLLALQAQDWVLRERARQPVLSAAERPWIAVQVGIASPLSNDAEGWDAGSRFHITLAYELKNTGHTPALGVDFSADMIPFLISGWPGDRVKNGVPQGPPIPGTDASSELAKFCDVAAKTVAVIGVPLMGRTLFKDQAIQGRFRINGDPALFAAAGASPAYSGNVLVLICATYRFAGDTAIHRTGAAYALFMKAGKRIELGEITIPAAQLGLVSEPMTTGIAD